MKYLVSILFLFLCVSCSSSDNDSDTASPPPNNTLASVNVVSTSDISENSATSGGNVTDDGGANVTSKGVCWSTSTDPTINDSKTSNGSGKGAYTSDLTNLLPNTLYHLRAFATNSVGTSYSSSISFTTHEEPNQCGSVLSTGIELKTQEDVENLGAQNISIINGNLIIDDQGAYNSDPIIDLSSLGCLEEVNGFIIINHLEDLESLQGFEKLSYTKGLSIINSNLTSISALSNLITVDGNLIISRITSLTNLDGLDNLTSVLGTVEINSNDEIENIEGLGNLQSVGEGFWLYDCLKIFSLNGLGNLITIGERLNILNNPQLINIDALANLNSTTGIGIERNPLLSSLSVFSNLEVSTLEWLDIEGNEALTDLNGFENITSITNFLDINYNDSLENLDALNNLSIVASRIEIKDNEVLSNIDGLIGITQCEYNIVIRDNPNLLNLNGMSNITSVGQLDIINNDALIEVNFSSLSTVNFNIEISYNDKIENLNGLTNLSTIESNFQIWDNGLLTNIDGLSNLLLVQGGLTIQSWGALTDVCGIQPLLLANGLQGDFNISLENFDVSEQDIIDGNCSQ